MEAFCTLRQSKNDGLFQTRTSLTTLTLLGPDFANLGKGLIDDRRLELSDIKQLIFDSVDLSQIEADEMNFTRPLPNVLHWHVNNTCITGVFACLDESSRSRSVRDCLINASVGYTTVCAKHMQCFKKASRFSDIIKYRLISTKSNDFQNNQVQKSVFCLDQRTPYRECQTANSFELTTDSAIARLHSSV